MSSLNIYFTIGQGSDVPRRIFLKGIAQLRICLNVPSRGSGLPRSTVYLCSVLRKKHLCPSTPIFEACDFHTLSISQNLMSGNWMLARIISWSFVGHRFWTKPNKNSKPNSTIPQQWLQWSATQALARGNAPAIFLLNHGEASVATHCRSNDEEVYEAQHTFQWTSGISGRFGCWKVGDF